MLIFIANMIMNFEWIHVTYFIKFLCVYIFNMQFYLYYLFLVQKKNMFNKAVLGMTKYFIDNVNKKYIIIVSLYNFQC